jgi:hypothetical protein
MNSKLQVGKGGKRTKRTGKNQLTRRRSTLDCSNVYEEEDVVCGWRTGLLTKITISVWSEVTECQQAYAQF